jgi:hypothetical protein
VSRGKQFIDRWKEDYDFKTFTGAFGAVAVTLVYALYNGYLGVRYASLWYGAICVYYLMLSLLRGSVIRVRKTVDTLREREAESVRSTVCVTEAVMLLFLNAVLVVPVTLMVRLQKPVTMTLIPAIAMAAYTTYKIVMASVHLAKRKQSSDSLVKLLRTINFVDALASILVLQNTLIMVCTDDGGGASMRRVTSAVSAVIMVAILVLSVFALVKGIRSGKQRRKPDERTGTGGDGKEQETEEDRK